jgi:hypothetical protein
VAKVIDTVHILEITTRRSNGIHTYRYWVDRIQGWIQKPPDFDPQKKYSLILNIHGGPHAAYGWVFDHEFQWMAAKGYVVLYVNPRGSTSYGQEFGNIIQYHYPGDDYRDLMVGVDELIKRGYVDQKKLGVTGGSGGGVLTDWTITRIRTASRRQCRSETFQTGPHGGTRLISRCSSRIGSRHRLSRTPRTIATGQRSPS